MCSFNTTEYDISEMEKTNADIIPSLVTSITDVHNVKPRCKKCTFEEAQVFLRNKNEYCKTCFLHILVHKFRATLGKSKLIRQQDSILIAHSGKANSTVLSHIIATDTNESNNKKLCFQYKVLYIDDKSASLVSLLHDVDGAVKGYTADEREMFRNAFAEEAKKFKLPAYIVSLSKSVEDVTFDDVHLINTLPSNVCNEDAVLHRIFKNLETDTARHELLHQLRQKLLLIVARKLNCSKVFVADTSVDLATKVLGDMSTGRGSQLPFNVAFSDMRHKDVTLLRPLRDFTADDIDGYLNCCELHPIFSSQKYNLLFPNSIRNITKNFVHELESNFYGTISTIYRTSEKLATRINELASSVINRDTNVSNPCIICELPANSLSSPKEEFSVMQAKLLSELVSTVGDYTSNVYSLNICKTLNDKQADAVNALTTERCRCDKNSCSFLQRQINIDTHLCYSCKLIFLNSKQMDNILPSFIVKAIERKYHTARMRQEIADFLL